MDRKKVQSESEIKRIIRYDFFKSALQNFEKIYKLSLEQDDIKSIAKSLVDIYYKDVLWKIKKEMSKPDERIDIHKIIAGSQYVIMRTLLIRDRSELTPHKYINPTRHIERRNNMDIVCINAKFALFFALYALYTMHKNTGSDTKKLLNGLSQIAKRTVFFSEFLKLLMLSKPSNFPVFPLAQICFLVDFYCNPKSRISS